MWNIMIYLQKWYESGTHYLQMRKDLISWYSCVQQWSCELYLDVTWHYVHEHSIVFQVYPWPAAKEWLQWVHETITELPSLWYTTTYTQGSRFTPLPQIIAQKLIIANFVDIIIFVF